MMPGEVGEHGGPKVWELDAFTGELGEPTALRSQEPSHEPGFFVRIPACGQPGDGLRDMKLSHFISLGFELAQELCKSLIASILAQQADLLPANITVAIREILEQILGDSLLHRRIGYKRFLE